MAATSSSSKPRLDLLLQPMDDVLAGMTAIADAPRVYVSLLSTLVLAGLCWFVYVPIHEFLHVLGCVATGGTVSELEIQAIYAGEFLADIFPFVVVGGEYAGRLSGFDTHGSDFIYLATVFGPYVLTVAIGVPGVLMSRTHPVLFGPAIVIGLAPFYGLHGDYYEMGSILTTWLAAIVAGGDAGILGVARAEDVTLLLSDLFLNPAELGLSSGADTAVVLGMVALSLCLGILLAFLTYRAGSKFYGLLGLGEEERSSSS